MRINNTLKLLTCCAVLAACTGKTPGKPENENLVRAQITLDSLYAHYSVPTCNLLRENFPFNGNYNATYLASEEQAGQPNPYSYLWPYSGTFSAVNALYQATNDGKYRQLLDTKVLPGLEEYFDSERTPPAYASYTRKTAPLPDRFYDDNIWLGIDFADTYMMTQDTAYLAKAKLIWKFIQSGTDETLGGGTYWCEQKKGGKNTCSNAPGSVLAFKLFEATGDSLFFIQGRDIYQWTQKNLQDSSDYLYYDNIRLDGKIGKAKYAYNSGQMMQASALLYKLTGDKKYLDEAKRLAKACYNYFFTDFTSPENEHFRMICKGDVWFTAVMLRGFIELYNIDNDKTYINAFGKSLDYAWKHARDEHGLFNVDFSGTHNDTKKWLLTQAAMVEMYARMAKYMNVTNMVLPKDKTNVVNHSSDNAQYKCKRPAADKRLFTSQAVEEEIIRVKKLLTNRKLAWMFENCFPNTLETTVHYRTLPDGRPDTFVYTGDIHAMWLRDSGAQVWPYIQLADKDPELRKMLAGVINRQFLCILTDPYANAFNDGPEPNGDWMSDLTDMKPELHERKWEIDSLCYPLRLAYQYWKETGDASVFGKEWLQAIRIILQTFKEQQRKEGVGPYKFQRKTERALDTLNNDGLGAPVKPVGLIVSSFRPSDDATTLQFLVPSNFFAITSLRKAAEILTTVNNETALAKECRDLAQEVENALHKYAIYDHPKYGKIYAFEVDGFGNQLLMDDANVPSLLAMPYLGDVDVNDPIYQNTRRFVWSQDNPYFFKGKAGEGIGGPHIGYDMVWPMSIMMKAFTSQDDAEIKACIKMLMDTDAGTGFMHESFHKDNAEKFTRAWFAWQNTLFGELVLKLVNEGKAGLLNGIE